MGAFTRRHRKQKALYWEATEADDFGTLQMKSSIELKVRWEWKTEVEQNDFGETVKTEANVVVDRRIPEGSLLWLNETEKSCGISPTEYPEGETVYQVYAYFGSPTLDGNPSRTRHRVKVLRYKDRLPTIISSGQTSC